MVWVFWFCYLQFYFEVLFSCVMFCFSFPPFDCFPILFLFSPVSHQIITIFPSVSVSSAAPSCTCVPVSPCPSFLSCVSGFWFLIPHVISALYFLVLSFSFGFVIHLFLLLGFWITGFVLIKLDFCYLPACVSCVWAPLCLYHDTSSRWKKK